MAASLGFGGSLGPFGALGGCNNSIGYSIMTMVSSVTASDPTTASNKSP